MKWIDWPWLMLVKLEEDVHSDSLSSIATLDGELTSSAPQSGSYPRLGLSGMEKYVAGSGGSERLMRWRPLELV